ncbi:MAG: PQQ-dependent sugar dehydrogenase [Thermoleophilia bacterium]
MRRRLVIVVLAAVAVAAALFTQLPRPGEGSGLEGASDGPPLAPAAVAAPPAVSLSPVPGRFDQPVYVAAAPGDSRRLFVVEKTGRIRIVKGGAALGRPFLDIAGLVSSEGERGLLSMAFHPRFAANGRFYIDYTDRDGDTRVVSYRVSASDPDRARPASRRVLLRVAQPYSNHNGGQLQFGPDGRLYVGMGDGGGAGDPQGRAQDPRSRLGKLLRITLGTPPLRVGVYAVGLRNPWRFSFDRATGALWIADVGQDAWEEVDYLRPGRPAGANLGWNGFEGRHVYDRRTAARLDRSRLVWPVAEYGHSAGQSITGGYVYRGSAVPALRGFYVFGDFASGRVWAIKGPRTTPTALPGADGAAGAISSFGEDAAGELYIVDLAGTVFRFAPAP